MARERRQDDGDDTVVLAFVEGFQYNQAGWKEIPNYVEGLYDEFFQLIWDAGIGYVRMCLESAENFALKRRKELSKLMGDGGKYKIRVTAFCTIA
jgi:hypothetical protein